MWFCHCVLTSIIFPQKSEEAGTGYGDQPPSTPAEVMYVSPSGSIQPNMVVLVCSACIYSIPQTELYIITELTELYIITFLEARHSRSRCFQLLFQVMFSSWQEALSLRLHVAPLFAQREKDLCVSPFSKKSHQSYCIRIHPYDLI